MTSFLVIVAPPKFARITSLRFTHIIHPKSIFAGHWLTRQRHAGWSLIPAHLLASLRLQKPRTDLCRCVLLLMHQIAHARGGCVMVDPIKMEDALERIEQMLQAGNFDEAAEFIRTLHPADSA